MFVRWANAPGSVTAFYRLFFSTLILTPFFIRRSRWEPPIARKVWMFSVVAGIFTACDLSLWSSSLAFTTAANATFLGNTAPLWVALGAWLIFREKLTRRFWLGLVLTLTGAALIMGGDFLLQPHLGTGDLMASGAALFYASYLLSTQRARQHIDVVRYMWLIGAAASVTLAMINVLFRNSFLNYDVLTWLVFIATAIIVQIVGYTSFAYALGHLPARVVSPTQIGQPILTTILAIPLLGEIPNSLQALGGLIAVSGIFIVNQSHNAGSTMD